MSTRARARRTYDMSSRAESSRATRERILTAALGLFRDEPFDAITMARIARLAGVSLQTVVLHFRTKTGLIEALAEWWQPKEEELRHVEDGDPRVAAERICARYEEMGAMTLRLLASEDRLPERMRALIEAGRQSHRAWVERTFARGLGVGAARRRRTMALVAVYDIYTWHVLRRVLSPDETIATMTDMAEDVLARARAKGVRS